MLFSPGNATRNPPQFSVVQVKAAGSLVVILETLVTKRVSDGLVHLPKMVFYLLGLLPGCDKFKTSMDQKCVNQRVIIDRVCSLRFLSTLLHNEFCFCWFLVTRAQLNIKLPLVWQIIYYNGYTVSKNGCKMQVNNCCWSAVYTNVEVQSIVLSTALGPAEVHLIVRPPRHLADLSCKWV